MWNPCRGCYNHSDGCKYCYIHKGGAKKGIDTGEIIRLDGFDVPVARKKNGENKIISGQTVYLCFSSDLLLPEADQWRPEYRKMIRERSDFAFLFLCRHFYFLLSPTTANSTK